MEITEKGCARETERLTREKIAEPTDTYGTASLRARCGDSGSLTSTYAKKIADAAEA